MEKQPIKYSQEFTQTFKNIGHCIGCADKGKNCNNANDTQKVVYEDISKDGSPIFIPHLEQGRVEDCIIFKRTAK